jgi:pantetheine-phosphate adenylyltransferase
MKRALYPGTFDPITNGHLDIIKRASKIFDEVIVAVANSDKKNPMFTVQQRVDMAKIVVKDLPSITVISFDNLLVESAKSLDVEFIVRGIRAVSDFEYELQMGYANSSLNPDIEIIYLMPTLENAFISSSIVRSILEHKGDITHLVSRDILELISKGN